MPSLLAELEATARVVYEAMTPTIQQTWPLLSARVGTELWVKHENHTPIGSFKARSGLAYLEWVRREHPAIEGVICATRGNFGQSIAFAAARMGVPSVLVVPHGNSREKNAAMRALGGEVVEHGADFQDAYVHAASLAEHRRLHLVRSFHRVLWLGTASYGLELLRAVPDLDVIYVPIGQGSGICGVIAARDALGARARVVGVVAEKAAGYALSFAASKVIATDSAATIADGMACRVPDAEALPLILRGAEAVVTVSEAGIRAAMRHYFTDTHNVAEGAAGAPLAAVLADAARLRGKKVAVVLTGGNVDRPVFAEVLQES
jgi:threonine dehydratase